MANICLILTEGPRTYTKYQWKQKTKHFVREQNRDQLLEKMKRYKKLDYEKCRDEKFVRKDYFYSSNRFHFRISNKMVKNERKTSKECILINPHLFLMSL